jgi:hypothetical protein
MLHGRTLLFGASALLCSWLSATAAAQTRFSLKSVDLGEHQSLEKEISQDPSSDYLHRLANAVTFLQAGTTSDYSTPFQHIVLNVGAGLGYQSGYAGFGEVISGQASPDSLAAFSAQAALSLGLKFTRDQRSRFFASFASSDYSNNGVKLESWGWGLMWQYDLVRATENPSPLLAWNGLRFGTGFRWNSFDSHYAKSFEALEASLYVPGQGTVSGSIQGDLDVSANVKTMSVPLELGTSLRWMSVLSVYAVAGLDANFGDARGALYLRGPVSVQTTAEDDEASKTQKGDARYSISKSEKPEPFSMRGLLGLQFELGRGSVFIQYQESSLKDAEAAALGFRTYF